MKNWGPRMLQDLSCFTVSYRLLSLPCSHIPIFITIRDLILLSTTLVAREAGQDRNKASSLQPVCQHSSILHGTVLELRPKLWQLQSAVTSALVGWLERQTRDGKRRKLLLCLFKYRASLSCRNIKAAFPRHENSPSLWNTWPEPESLLALRGHIPKHSQGVQCVGGGRAVAPL